MEHYPQTVMSRSLYGQDSSPEVILIVVKLPEGHRSIAIACLTTIQHQNPSVGTPNTKVPLVIVRVRIQNSGVEGEENS